MIFTAIFITNFYEILFIIAKFSFQNTDNHG